MEYFRSVYINMYYFSCENDMQYDGLLYKYLKFIDFLYGI